MTIQKIKDILQFSEYVKQAWETDKYINTRYSELIEKGFPHRKALDMIIFERTTSQMISIPASKASADACFSAAAIQTFEAVLPVSPNAAIPTSIAVGTGAAWACGKGVDITVEAGVQRISEFLWAEFKRPEKLHIDLNKAGMYITSNDPYITAAKPQEAFIYARKSYIELPKNLKYTVDTKTGTYTPVPKSWQDYYIKQNELAARAANFNYKDLIPLTVGMEKLYNKPQDFKSLNIEKQLSMKNPTVEGVSGGVDNAITDLIVHQALPKISANKLGWLGQLGNILSLAGSAVGTIVGVAGGLGGGAAKFVSATIVGASYHTGGKIRPQKIASSNSRSKDEVLAILRGGETVRTEAQEQELQLENYKELIAAMAPLFEEKNKKTQSIAEAYDPDNKIPCLLNKTSIDEEIIIDIIAKAWKSNRLGLRNVLRYE